jgi:hypothetical protein
LIETITEFAVRRDLDPRAFVSFIMETLDNPVTIWEHAFRYQLDRIPQLLLLALLSLPDGVTLEDLAACVGALSEADGLGREADRAFARALRTVEGTFIRISERSGRRAASGARIVSFANPSVRDFLHGYLRRERSELLLLVRAAQYFDQIDLLWRYGTRSSHATSGTPAPLATRELAASGAWDLANTMIQRFDASLEVEREIRLSTNSWTFRWCAASREDRLISALSITAELEDPVCTAWCAEQLRALVPIWKEHRSPKHEAVWLLRAVQGLTAPELQGPVADLEMTAREWFLSSLNDGADFTAFHELHRAAHNVFEREDVRTAIARFNDYANALTEQLENEDVDVDYLAGELDDLQRFAYGVRDAEVRPASLSELIERVEEREREADDEDRAEQGDEPSTEDAEIDAMFGALVEAPSVSA